MGKIAPAGEQGIRSVLNDKVHLSETGLVFRDKPTFADWQEVGNTLSNIESAVGFWIGDWLNFGETRFGEKYAQALDTTAYKQSTLENYAYVCGRVPAESRVKGLSFSVHAEVAPLDPEEQREVLLLALENDWTVKDTRNAVKARRIVAGEAISEKAKFTEYVEVFERHGIPTPELPNDPSIKSTARLIQRLEERQLPIDSVAVRLDVLTVLMERCSQGDGGCVCCGVIHECPKWAAKENA